MADPVTWLAIIGGVVSAAGAVQQGKQADAAAQSQANMDEYNAKKADQQAEHSNRMAGIKEDDQRRRVRAAVGNQVANSAQAGAGLNSDLLRQSIYDGEMDTAAIRYEGALAADGYESSAAIQRSNAVFTRAQGKSAMTAGYLNAAGSLVGAGKSYFKK